METVKRTFEVTIAGETRLIAFQCWFEGLTRFDSISNVGLFQKRPGQKKWANNLCMWLQKDGSYKLGFSTTILNRSGYRLIGWADDKANSEHNSARRVA